jgi:hypothetical protein
MAKINLKEGEGSNITPLPKSTYQAVISGVWDIGLQEHTYMNETKMKHKIMFRFEVNKVIEDEGTFKGKRYNILKEINIPEFFGDKAALIKLASAAFGREMTKEDFSDFDTDTLLGKNLMIATGFTSGGNAKIESFSTLMDVLQPIEPELEPDMPDWVSEKATAGAEALQAASVNTEDDLPF